MARILIVDDDSMLADTISTLLSFEKHAVTVVNTGQAGWDCLQKNKYEAIVLDWDLPDVSGIEILKQFREAGGTTPIIMLTGHSSIDDKAAGFDSGANDYLTKPFHLKELGMRVKAMLKMQVEAAAPAPLGQGNVEILKRADLIGTRLAANYEFLEILGEGAAGVIFKARHPRLDKLVAIKMLHSAEPNEVAFARFEREARAISHINHYNVVTVHDFGVTERNKPYMVMEHVQGGSLQEKIAREGPLPPATAAAILIQVCRGLQEAHSAGILHRDLKPENILLQEKGDRLDWVKLADFGLAHLLDGGQERLTSEGAVVGTLLFLAPERLKNVTPDARSDIYSLGVVLFEALTARPIFEAETIQNLLMSILMDPPAPPSRFRKDIEAGSPLDSIVLKATEKDPDKRYQTATEMRLDLEQVHNQLLVNRRGTAGD